MNQNHIDAIRAIAQRMAGCDLYVKRSLVNALNPPQVFERGWFWEQVVGCLCTSVQKVYPDSPVMRFLRAKPFPLRLETCECEHNLQGYAQSEISKGGLRFGKSIAERLVRNLTWLRDDGWSQVEQAFVSLSRIPQGIPANECIVKEREAAHLAMKLCGIGPKQSRNLWICLGLTRYEIPLDSRVAGWFNKLSPPFVIEVRKLGRNSYYEEIESKIQFLCEAAGVLPCLMDAAVFSSFETNPELAEGNSSSSVLSKA